MSRTLHAAASLSLGFVLAAHAAAQSPADVMNRVKQEYERRTRGIDDYTLVQDAMGIETTAYFEKEVVDGHPIFRLKKSAAQSVDMTGMAKTDEQGGAYDEVYRLSDQIAEHASYEGKEKIDGRDVHVLAIPDLSSLDLSPDMGDNGDFQPKDGKLYIDVETNMPRRMEFEGQLTNDQGAHQVTSTVDLTDYREVEGMLFPYRTAITLRGMGQAMDEETKAQYEEMQKQLESMPESQRAMMEKMMGGQLDKIRQMMEAGGDVITMEVDVKEVRVNTGPPGA